MRIFMKTPETLAERIARRVYKDARATKRRARVGA